MVDLKSQYLKIKNEVNKAIENVLSSAQFIGGTEVKNFSEELAAYLSVNNVIPCGNGTDALQIAMMALDLKPGDEVITTSFTYVATAEVIALLGLKPVFVEVDPSSFTIDPAAIEKAITTKTKAIIPVHLYGQCADMESIMTIAEKNHLFVIEDVAQAIGADYIFRNGTKKKAGTIGHVGCTSFFPSKNLGCYGDGGAIYTNDTALAKKIKMIANHGQSSQYVHDLIGVNSRLDNIQAAILRIKLRHLDEYAGSRNSAAAYYDKAFSGNKKIIVPARKGFSDHVFHQYTIKLNGVDRNALQMHLKNKGIDSKVYYPVPLHRQKAYSNAGSNTGGFTITDKLCETVLSLPMNTELDERTLKYIADSVLEFTK